MNFLLRPYAVSCGMKRVERRATRLALVKLESVNGERQERGTQVLQRPDRQRPAIRSREGLEGFRGAHL